MAAADWTGARRREIAIRAVLGAGRERLLRQLLTESLLLAGLGGMLGIVLAAATAPVLSRLVPRALPIAETSPIDFPVIAFAVMVTIFTGIVFGIAPVSSSSIAIVGARGCAKTYAPAVDIESGCAGR